MLGERRLAGARGSSDAHHDYAPRSACARQHHFVRSGIKRSWMEMVVRMNPAIDAQQLPRHVELSRFPTEVSKICGRIGSVLSGRSRDLFSCGPTG